ncbi:hypothetical protein BGZ96_001929 [Linnemannia gamsii]|uniref:Uncharacterized protein n=1 Tax=Linnemannia gamsii TaxID=64522 RepID=A0ABQ7JLF4_9FUNG|nr:hypothetical protein BGZ96_001929 [Linnemannia gamsii]
MYFYGHLIWIGFLIFLSVIYFVIRARRAALAASTTTSQPQGSVIVIEPAHVPMHPYQPPVPAQYNQYQAQPSVYPQGYAPDPMLQYQQQQHQQYQQHLQQQQQYYPPQGQHTPFIQPQQTPLAQPQQTPYLQPQQAPYIQQQHQQDSQPLQTNLQAAPFSPSIMSPPPVYTAASSLPEAPYPALQPAPPVAFGIGSSSTSNAMSKGGSTPKPSDAFTVDPSKPWQPSPYPAEDGSSAGTSAKPRQPQAPQGLS